MTEMDLRAQNEAKKEYLRNYQRHVRRVQQITDEIAELREKKMGASAKPGDGMPHSGGHSDLSGYAARLDEMIAKLIDEREQCMRTYQQIARQIKYLRDRQEMDVLFYRYVGGMDWGRVAERLGCTTRWVHKVHGRALIHFRLPKNT